MKITDVEDYIFDNNLYSEQAQVYKNVDRCATYLGAFLEANEEILTAAFSTIEYLNAKKGAAYLLLFTNKRIIIGYKYLFGLLKAEMEIPYSALNDLTPIFDDETGKITLKTANGDLSFFITSNKTYKWKSEYGFVNGSMIVASQYIRKLIYCFAQDIKKNSNGEERKTAEEIEKKCLNEIEKINDKNKAYLFVIENVESLSKEHRESIIKSGWAKFVETNPEFKDYDVWCFSPL